MTQKRTFSVDRMLTEAARCAKQGNWAQARQLCDEVLARFPANRRAGQLLRSLPATGPARPRPDPAAAAQAELEALFALYNHGRMAEVIARGTALAKGNPHHPMIPNVIGAAHAALGQLEPAITAFRSALAIEPRLFMAENNLGAALARLGRYDEAIACYERALALKPDYAEAVHNLANALYQLGRYDEAIGRYREALTLSGDNPEIHASLCSALELTNRLDAFRDALREAEQRCGPGIPRLDYLQGVLASRDGRHEAARDLLEAIDGEALPIEIRVSWSELLAKTLDRLDDVDAAFRQCASTNRLAAEWHGPHDIDAARYREEVNDLITAWSGAAEINWKADTPDIPKIRLAFLVGFPRSGTTLLDTVLRSHPDIEVIEEQPILAEIREALGALPTPDVLAALNAGEISDLRAAYLDGLSRIAGDIPEGKLIIDKLPLNMIYAGLARRIFPDASFVLALRHPCDCVLSCFMQNFRLNDAMANFLELDDSARLYDAVMTLWRHYAGSLRLDVTAVRYEDMVADLRQAVEPALRSLGLDWHDDMAGYRETALARDRIMTPSYNQVTQDLYGHASGRWQRYRDQMAPVLSILRPWAKNWGYPL